jgi:pimeloyl-ACP methyl ester carboxylesterase
MGLDPTRLFELGTGHMVMLEDPEQLNEIMDRLIKDL